MRIINRIINSSSYSIQLRNSKISDLEYIEKYTR